MNTPLAAPGPVWGASPSRAADADAPTRGGGALSRIGRLLRRARDRRSADGVDALSALQAGLRRQGLGGAARESALAVVAQHATITLGQTPRANQLQAASALLDQRLVEMPTGEGKTLAVALAAAVAALAGVPVHVVTANAYLARRDADAMQPLYRSLGLAAAARPGADDDDARRAVYAAPVVYTTAHDLAFDFLRDRQARSGRGALEDVALALAGTPRPPPVMRGLCLALLDEADSILLDEAEMPLVLSGALAAGADQAARRAQLWQALALARRLAPGDYVLDAPQHRARLTEGGEQALAAWAAALGPHARVWQRPRWRCEVVQTALAALHLYRRDCHYLLRAGAVEVLDEVTGRAAPGRVWSRGLHVLIALKEGLPAPAEMQTVARTSFQRFFQRYWHLAGISGTLWEARAELAADYQLTVQRIAPHRPCRRQPGPTRSFGCRTTMFAAAAQRSAALARAGRPVLLGTDSVADSQVLSAALTACGVPHQVLNALNDAAEAAIVAAAGRAGQVTVATRMAGRGTDIEPDGAALAAGGLHVLSCQHNPSPRLDRQLAGRAARRGQPGSAERWLCTAGPDPLTQVATSPADSYRSWTALVCPDPLRGWLARAGHWLAQRGQSRRRRRLRRDLLQQDLRWERDHDFAGSAD